MQWGCSKRQRPAARCRCAQCCPGRRPSTKRTDGLALRWRVARRWRAWKGAGAGICRGWTWSLRARCRKCSRKFLGHGFKIISRYVSGESVNALAKECKRHRARHCYHQSLRGIHQCQRHEPCQLSGACSTLQ
jgi:hypothetical protein